MNLGKLNMKKNRETFQVVYHDSVLQITKFVFSGQVIRNASSSPLFNKVSKGIVCLCEIGVASTVAFHLIYKLNSLLAQTI